MKSPKDLYDLIHSLTPSEKSYFKKSSKTDGNTDKAYIKLFDILNEMNEFDEKIVQAKLIKSRIEISLPKLKEYLYKNILNTLLSIYINKNDDIKFYGDAIKTKILIHKQLYMQAKDLNEESRLAANSFFQHAELASTFMTESIYNRYTESIDDLRNYEVNNFQKHIDALDNAKFDALHHMITNKIIYFVTKHNSIVKEETKEEIKNEIEHHLKAFSACKIPTQKANYYGLIAIYANMIGDLTSEFVYKMECINVYMSDKELQKKVADSTIIAFQNFFYIIRLRKQYDLFDTTFALYTNFINNNKKYLSTYGITLIDQIELLNRFLISKDMGLTNICDQLTDKLKNWAIQSKNLMPYYRMIALMNLIDYYYCVKDYSNAIKMIQLVFETSTVKYSKFTATAFFYQVLIYFEEEEFAIATNLIKPLYRYLMQSKIDASIIKLFIETIKTVSNTPNFKLDTVTCDSLLEKIYLPENKFSAILETFCLEYWCLAKRNKTSYYAEYIKHKKTPNDSLKGLISAKRKELQLETINLFPEIEAYSKHI